MEINDKGVVELIKVGKSMGVPQSVPGGNIQYAVIPLDMKIASLAEFTHNSRSERPLRKSGTVTTLDSPSFCEYYTLFSDENSRVFADETKAKILAVLDYHAAGENAPRWGQHRIDLTLRHSEEWKRWKAKDGVRTPQMEFAEFIEDNAPDIIRPDAATMLEVARDLSAKSEVDFGSAVRMQNGTVQFKYSEQLKASFGAGQVEVPERFDVSIPVYIGSERVKITARLRYRISSGKLTFWYDLLRADVVERSAFLDVLKMIADTLSITVINGSPAAS